MIGQLERRGRLRARRPAEAQARQARGAAGAGRRTTSREAAPLLADAARRSRRGGRYPPLDAHARSSRSERTLRRRCSTSSRASRARRPVLVVFEDVHWIDPTTLELLDLVVERIAAPAGAAAAHLPARRSQPPWAGTRTSTRAHAEPPRPRHERGDRRAADRRQGAAAPRCWSEIVARTDGVPLFVEELTKAVLEAGCRAGDRYAGGPLPPLAIPATLHDSLMARLDRLARGQGGGAGRGRASAASSPTSCWPRWRPLREAELRGRARTSSPRPSWSSARGDAARGELHLQARAGAGRGLREPAQEPAAAAARPHRRGRWRSASRRRRTPSPSCWPTTTPRRGWPSRRSTTGSGPGSGRSRARRWPRRSRT